MTTTSDRDRIFISYRRTDSAVVAGRLRDAMRQLLGEHRVFQDVDMDPGTAFPDALRAELDRAAVLLVVMSDDWLSSADADGSIFRIFPDGRVEAK